jgi:hypothetical protein
VGQVGDESGTIGLNRKWRTERHPPDTGCYRLWAESRIVYTMNDLSFSPIFETEQTKAYGTLVSAFTEDPVERWLYPELAQYLAHFPLFLRSFGGKAFDEQTVWCLGEFSAVALWLPPGAEPDGDAIGAVLTETVSPDKHGDTFAVLEQMDAAHPTYPHWYLPWFGVDPLLHGLPPADRTLWLSSL